MRRRLREIKRRRTKFLLAIGITLGMLAGGQASQDIGSVTSPEVAVADMVYAMQWVKANAENEWYAGIVRAEEARRRTVATHSIRSYPSAGSVGECTGFPIPDYIIQRESGGNPNAHNPSGAHGCSQTLLSHYAPGGACEGDDPYTVDGQRSCTYTLSDGGRNLAPWSATR